MDRRPLLLLLPLALAACDRSPPSVATVAVAPAAPAPERVSLVDLSPADGALAPLLRREATAAQKRGMKTVVEIGATWCKPCQLLRASLGDPQMVAAFRGVHVVRLDLDAWEPQLAGVGIEAGAIPAFYPVDENGRATRRVIIGDAWDEDVPAKIAPKLKSFFGG